MYKRVTHTITEEHFGHPMAAEIKQVIDKTVKPPKPKMEPAAASKFKADVENYFTSLSTNLTAVSRAIVANDEAKIIDTEKVLFDNIDFLGNLYKQYYGVEFGEKLSANLRTTAFIVIAITKNLKNKLDIRDWKSRFDAVRSDVSNMMYQYNNNWKQQDLSLLLLQILDQIIAHTQDIVNGSEAAAELSANKLRNVLSVFANSLITGAIQQYPERFIS
jgi:hypothetical protein